MEMQVFGFSKVQYKPYWLLVNLIFFHVLGTYSLVIFVGFGEIMGTLARIGLLSTESCPVLTDGQRPSFKSFLSELLKISSENLDGTPLGEKDITESIVALGHCKEQGTAVKAAKTIM